MAKVSDKVIKSLRKRIKEMYNNYGIDVCDMGDDEFGRLIRHYLEGASDIDEDLSRSQRHVEKYSDEDLI